MSLLIKDFFSHKIHATDELWADQLCLFAHIFARYDGQEYNRDIIKKEFDVGARRWSPKRADPYYRDVVTAYPTFLGLCHFLYEDGKWVVRMTETAKQFLLGESPDTSAFLRLQLPLLQYPLIASGIRHTKNGPKLQAMTRDKKQSLLNKGVVVSPLRLLVKSLLADCHLRQDENIFGASVSFNELYELANNPTLFQSVQPNTQLVSQELEKIRRLTLTKMGEHRFALLEQTDLFQATKQKIKLRSPENDREKAILRRQFDAIDKIDAKFKFSKADLFSSEALARWANHFDAVKTLSPETIAHLSENSYFGGLRTERHISEPQIIESAPLREFNGQVRPYTKLTPQDLKKTYTLADPEATRIKQERRNMIHGDMVDKLCAWLETSIKAKVGDSIHIDLWAHLPNGEDFIFEVKSGGESAHEQLRKGLSQLYEYRYRYKGKFKQPSLCIVFPEDLPHEWLSDYLCNDREINICFLRKNQSRPEFHRLSRNPVKAPPLATA